MSTDKHTGLDRLAALSPLDRCLTVIQLGLLTVWGRPTATRPPSQPSKLNVALTDEEKHHSGGLMRVNAVGEICAQGLYLGQALAAHAPQIRQHMLDAAYEELDHLAWCNNRLEALGARSSYLIPLWFIGSVMLGATMGLVSDRFSLGFIMETEKQVMAHIEKHLNALPPADKESQQVLRHMYRDERVHADAALRAGGQALPAAVKTSMTFLSKVMTTLTYYV